MSTKRALCATLIVGALAIAAPAWAKGLEPLRVVSPSGRVGWIRGADAKAFWRDLAAPHRGDCVCRTPDAAALFVLRLGQKWADWPNPILIAPVFGVPMLYYEATRTPSYIVTPGATGVNQRQWEVWKVVTPRMRRIIATALHGHSSGFPTAWVAGGALGGIALLGAILVSRRRRPLLRGLTRAATSLLP